MKWTLADMVKNTNASMQVISRYWVNLNVNAMDNL